MTLLKQCRVWVTALIHAIYTDLAPRRLLPTQPLGHQPRHRAFFVTRWQLAFWYTIATTLILLLAGLVVYRLIVHARWLRLEREMQSLATLLEHRVEPFLPQAGEIDKSAQTQIPELCFYPESCTADIADSATSQLPTARISELVYTDLQDGVCIRLVDPANRPVAWVQLRDSPDFCQNPQIWERRKDSSGHYFHKRVYPLRTLSHEDWGTIHILRSLNDLDLYMLRIEIALVGVIVIAIGLAGLASWQLAKLSMRPVHYAYQQMEQFTADAAHELRSPLAALRAIVQSALRSEDLTVQEMQETLQILNRQSLRLSSLVQDLLMFSEIEQPVSQSPRQPCCLNQILTELLDEFMAMAMAAEIHLSGQLPVEALQVWGHPEQLHRAIANLISNALNYTPAGGRVTVTLTSEAARALIQVQDTGIGIAPEDQKRIFDRFYRVASDRASRPAGSGLGLAIAQAIVQSHQGQLTVQSRIQQGSQFTISLPLLKK